MNKSYSARYSRQPKKLPLSGFPNTSVDPLSANPREARNLTVDTTRFKTSLQ